MTPTRRSIFTRILSFCTVLPLAGTLKAKPPIGSPGITLPDSRDWAPGRCYLSFDARVWAKDFVEHAKANPAIATDPETMLAWFASALMRGHDEGWRSDLGSRLAARNEELRVENERLRAYQDCVEGALV
jgi:hypothetical protein